MSPTASSETAAKPPAGTPGREAGFSLASLLVILTVMAVFLAYTVPRMWSDVMRRQRERQTVFAMKQYARAILEYQKSHANTAPTQLAQLKDSRRPRVLRGVGDMVDPLSGKLDWVPVPFGTVTPGTTAPGTAAPGTAVPSPTPAPQPGGGIGGTPGTTATSGTGSATGQQPNAANFVGPFIGVRPGVTGESLIALNNQNRYEDWMYTITDLQKDINAQVGGGPPGSPAGVLH
jgi:type II secretory pathway pseudopilin PulG